MLSLFDLFLYHSKFYFIIAWNAIVKSNKYSLGYYSQVSIFNSMTSLAYAIGDQFDLLDFVNGKRLDGDCHSTRSVSIDCYLWLFNCTLFTFLIDIVFIFDVWGNCFLIFYFNCVICGIFLFRFLWVTTSNST